MSRARGIYLEVIERLRRRQKTTQTLLDYNDFTAGRKRKTQRSFSLCDRLVIVVVCGLSQKITKRFR